LWYPGVGSVFDVEEPVVKELSVYQVDVYDPATEPGRDTYLVYVYFDPATKRGYSTEAEFNLAGSSIAERLIRLDESASPGLMSRLRFRTNRVILDVESLKGGPHPLPTGITLWIELSPVWSRFRNQSLLKLQILMMRSDLRARSHAFNLDLPPGGALLATPSADGPK
jgi:hypothetical protein